MFTQSKPTTQDFFEASALISFSTWSIFFICVVRSAMHCLALLGVLFVSRVALAFVYVHECSANYSAFHHSELWSPSKGGHPNVRILQGLDHLVRHELFLDYACAVFETAAVEVVFTPHYEDSTHACQQYKDRRWVSGQYVDPYGPSVSSEGKCFNDCNDDATTSSWCVALLWFAGLSATCVFAWMFCFSASDMQ
jgi:hypothetical protein